MNAHFFSKMRYFVNMSSASVVKRISRLASDQVFRVRILTGAHRCKFLMINFEF